MNLLLYILNQLFFSNTSENLLKEYGIMKSNLESIKGLFIFYFNVMFTY